METEIINKEKEVLSIEKAIEEQRMPLFKEFKKSRLISNILTAVVLIICIAGMILVTNENLVLKIVGWVILALGLVSMVVFYFVHKKRFEKNTKNYIGLVAELLNKENFSNPNFKNVNMSNSKLEIGDVSGNGAYVDIFRVASRNISTGEYSSMRFTFSEAAFFAKGEKKNTERALFVGKYIDVLNNLKFKGNVLIQLVGEKPIDQINGIEGKEKLFEEGNFSIYGEKDFNFKNELGEQFISKIRKIDIANHLLNLAFSIWEGHTFVFLSYDDDVIAIPFDKPFNAEAFECYKKQLIQVFDALKYLGK